MKTLQIKQAVYAICVAVYAVLVLLALAYLAGAIKPAHQLDVWQKALAMVLLVLGVLGLVGFLDLMQRVGKQIEHQLYVDKVNEHEFENFLKKAMPRIVSKGQHMRVLSDAEVEHFTSQAFDEVANFQAAERMYWAHRALTA